MKRMVENSEKIEELANRAIISSDHDLMILENVEIGGSLLVDSSLSVDGQTEFNNTTNYYEHATFNNGLTTSNITTPEGTILNVINEEDYSISDSGANISITTINLGTAIAVTASISVSEQNGTYTIINFNTDKLNNIIGVIQMSGGPVCIVEKTITNDTMTITVTLNKNKAEYTVADYYNFSFIFGYPGKAL